MFESDAVSSHLVEYRRFVGGAAVGSNAFIAKVVCHDHDDVGAGRRVEAWLARDKTHHECGECCFQVAWFLIHTWTGLEE